MSLLYGNNEALDRVKAQMSQRNTGKIMYPSGTNGRGMPGGREPHAAGDSVGALPSEGGSRMKPMHGGKGMMGGVVKRNQKNAVDQQRSRHASGGQPRTAVMRDMDDGRECHKFGSGIKGDFKDLGHTIKKGWRKEIGEPAKHGTNKATQKIRQTANLVKRGAEAGAHEVKEGAKAVGRGVRDAYREHHSFGSGVKEAWHGMASKKEKDRSEKVKEANRHVKKMFS